MRQPFCFHWMLVLLSLPTLMGCTGIVPSTGCDWAAMQQTTRTAVEQETHESGWHLIHFAALPSSADQRLTTQWMYAGPHNQFIGMEMTNGVIDGIYHYNPAQMTLVTGLDNDPSRWSTIEAHITQSAVTPCQIIDTYAQYYGAGSQMVGIDLADQTIIRERLGVDSVWVVSFWRKRIEENSLVYLDPATGRVLAESRMHEPIPSINQK